MRNSMNQVKAPGVDRELRASFVETAFTNEQIQQAIAEETQRGSSKAVCVFLGRQIATDDSVPGV